MCGRGVGEGEKVWREALLVKCKCKEDVQYLCRV